MNPQLIPGNEQATQEFAEFREAVAEEGLNWSPEDTLAAWTKFKSGNGDGAPKGKKGK